MSGVVTPGAPAGRSAAFLEEIGVGPLWRLRRSPMPQEEEGAEEPDAGLRPAAAFIAAPPEPPPAVQLHADASRSSPAMVPRDSAAVTASVPAAERAAPEVPVSPAARFTAQDEDSAAWSDEPTPTVARVGPADDDSATRLDASAPSGPHIAADDDDSTAWFDDAPAPPAPVAVTAEAIARMDWDALKTAAATCTRCPLSRTRRAVVFGRGDPRAALMVLASAPGRADEKEGVAIGGDAGVLLQNMLAAAGLAGDAERAGYYVSHLVKCRPSGGEGAERAPAPDEIAACRPYLERELALTGARTVVTLGHPALRGLLGAGVPAARGAVQHIQAGARDVAVVATYHPADLLRQGENKAGAWADLCLARQTHGAGPA